MFWRKALGVRGALEAPVKHTKWMTEDEKWRGSSEMIDGWHGA